MTESRNKREGWYHLRIQGEHYRTFKKRYAIRYNLKPGTQAYRNAIIEECKDARNREVACFGSVEVTPGMMRDYILNDAGIDLHKIAERHLK